MAVAGALASHTGQKLFLKHFAGKKVLVCSNGPPLRHSNTLKHCSAKCFYFFVNVNKKMHLIPIQDFFDQKTHIIKKKKKN